MAHKCIICTTEKCACGPHHPVIAPIDFPAVDELGAVRRRMTVADFIYVDKDGKKVAENSPDKVQRLSQKDYDALKEQQGVEEKLDGDATGLDPETGEPYETGGPINTGGLITSGKAKGTNK